MDSMTYKYAIRLPCKRHVDVSSCDLLKVAKRAFVLYKWDPDMEVQTVRNEPQTNERGILIDVTGVGSERRGGWSVLARFDGKRWRRQETKFPAFVKENEVLVPMHLYLHSDEDFVRWCGESYKDFVAEMI